MWLHMRVLLFSSSVTIASAILQCGDDEVACPLPQNAPPNAGRCIDEDDWCNAKPHDCPGNKDETDCSADDCQDGLFHCDTKCIRNAWRCDKENDCADKTDEKDCTNVDSCGDKLYYCSADRKCIPEEWRCDGLYDCSDNADEQGCTAEVCKETERWFCKEDEICIPEKWRCDNIYDCPKANEDESQCTEQVCEETDRFFCPKEEKCISEHRRCNYVLDCDDGADEKKCEAENCRKEYYHCPKSMKCIPKYYVCDGYQDCFDVFAPADQPGDYSDEEGCTKCKLAAFKCPNQDKCIWHAHICDGDPDCEKGEEDYGCTCNDSTQFECYDSQCVDGNDVCDGTCDCADGSDENGPACPNSAQCGSSLPTRKRISNLNNAKPVKIIRKKSNKKPTRNDRFKPSLRTNSEAQRRFSKDRTATKNENKESLRRRTQEKIDEYRRDHGPRTRAKVGNPTYQNKLTKTRSPEVRQLQALLSAIRKNLNK